MRPGMFKYFLKGGHHRMFGNGSKLSTLIAWLTRNMTICGAILVPSFWVAIFRYWFWSSKDVPRRWKFTVIQIPASWGRSCRHCPWSDVSGIAFDSFPSDPCPNPRRNNSEKWTKQIFTKRQLYVLGCKNFIRISIRFCDIIAIM